MSTDLILAVYSSGDKKYCIKFENAQSKCRRIITERVVLKKLNEICENQGILMPVEKFVNSS